MLKINNIYYNKSELIQLATSKLISIVTPQWEKDIYTFINEWLSDSDYIVVKTSGSTGEPKTINLKKQWLEYSANQTCKFFNLTKESTAFLCLPASYIAGKMMIARAFVSGMNLIAVEPSGNPFINQLTLPTGRQVSQSPDSPDIPIVIGNRNRGNPQFDFTALTPFQLAESFESLKENPVVKTIIVGGGEISHWLEEKLQALPVEVFATYGMTETSSHIALRKVNGADKKDFFTVIGDTQINLDSRGCLTIKNQHLFDTELTTNDIVEIINENSFRWIGRIDNVINSGGVKIMPEEIEQSIAHLRPELMIVSSIHDSKLGELCVLVVEVENITEEEKSKLLSQIKTLVDQYQLPKKVLCTKDIPRTTNGKVDRNLLKLTVAKL